MSSARSVSQPSRFLGLLLCLLGAASVMVCYFELPLYTQPEGSDITGWQWVSESYTTIQILGATPTSIFGISWVLAPLVAVTLVGVLGVARFAFAWRYLAVLYLIVCVLGAIVLSLTLLLVLGGLRLGALGEAAGYALCFWADYIWRGPHPARPPYGMS